MARNQEVSNSYVCRKCKTRIVLVRHCTHTTQNPNVVHTAYPENVVMPAPENYRRYYHWTLADVKCAECNRYLGWRCMRANVNSNVYQEGKFAFYLRRLTYWNGLQMLDPARATN